MGVPIYELPTDTVERRRPQTALDGRGRETPVAASCRASLVLFGESHPPEDRMSLFPCSFCGQRAVGKMSSATWAWWRADQQRVAYRQRLCLTCFVQNVAGLEQATRDEPFHCPACHTDPSDDMDPVYLTVFIPGVGPLRLEMATCGACAVEIRNRAQQGAVQLDDREPQFGGQGTGPQNSNTPSAWAALGIEPRE